MIAKILLAIMAVNALIVLVAFSSYISNVLKNIFIEPLYVLASVGIIILSVITFAVVKKGA